MQVKPFQTFVLDSYARIGDRVAILIDQETRGWTSGQYKHLPDGKEGVIIGFNRNIRYVNRNQVYKDKPGVYMSNGSSIVKWNDGGNNNMSAHHIGPVDQLVIEERRKDTAYKEAFDTNTYIKPLPVIEYYEGDTVRIITEEVKDVVITGIDYYRIGEFCNDGITPMPIYDVKAAGTDSGPMTRVRETDIVELVARGNYWKLEHGQPLEFNDIQDKIHFYYSIGECIQLKSPVSGNYSWSIADIIKGVEDKTIAFIKMSPALFGATPRPLAYSIPGYPEIEEEARQHIKLDEFKQMLRTGELT